MTATEQKPQHQGYANPGAQGSVVTFKMGLGEIPATLVVGGIAQPPVGRGALAKAVSGAS